MHEVSSSASLTKYHMESRYWMIKLSNETQGTILVIALLELHQEAWSVQSFASCIGRYGT
jgi:hypothetical protein